MPIFKSIKPGTSLKNIINYVSKEFKQTQDTDTIKGVNVADNPNIATLQMLNTKNSFGKEEGRQYQQDYSDLVCGRELAEPKHI